MARAPRAASVGRLAASAGRESGMVVAGALGALAGSRAQVSRLFRERYPTVAVTGMTGVGKTALADRLSGHADLRGRSLRGRDVRGRDARSRDGWDGRLSEVGSAVMERRLRRLGGLRGLRFRVVPGENAATRLGALDEVFHDDAVEGVLHVVANGYATGRRAAGVSGPVPAVEREVQLARELEDWVITSHRIASMAVRRSAPTWLVIAVTKVDLYPDAIESVVRGYSPGSGTPFGDKVDELRALAGGAKLSVDVLPVCVEGGKDSPIPAKQRDAYLAALETRMAQLSGHR